MLVSATPEFSKAVGFRGVMLWNFSGLSCSGVAPRLLLRALASMSRVANWYMCKYPNSLGGMYDPGPGVSGFGTFLEVLLPNLIYFAVP